MGKVIDVMEVTCYNRDKLGELWQVRFKDHKGNVATSLTGKTLFEAISQVAVECADSPEFRKEALEFVQKALSSMNEQG